MWKRNVENFLGCDKDYEQADVVLFGAPFDSTTSYRPGARFASRAIRGESYGIETYSPYQNKDLTEISVYDYGDLELCIGDTKMVLDQISELTGKILDSKKLPVMIGGEHLVSFAAVREAVKRFPNLHMLQFDAHADLRNDYLGVVLSHATVMKRCWELVGDNRIFQLGIRSGDREEFEFAAKHTYIHKYNFDNLDEILERLKGKPVYFTLDLDVLDPSVFPGTGTPEAGGVSFSQLHEAIMKLGSLHLVGCDITELAPNYDPSGVSTAVACKVLRELLLAIS